MPVSDAVPGTALITQPATSPVSTLLTQPVVIFMRCTENRVEDDYDGGLLLLQGVKGQQREIVAELNDSRLVLSAVNDEFMRLFPVTREEKQSRFYRITVEEVSYADVPPDPNAPPALFNADGQRVNAHGDLLR